MPRACFFGLSRNVVLLAIASLFTDISTEMLYPVLPAFLTQTLGASGSIVGLIDGCAQAHRILHRVFPARCLTGCAGENRSR